MNGSRTNAELKAVARGQLLGNYKMLAGYVALLGLISMFINSLTLSITAFSVWTELLVSLIGSLLGGIILTGFIRICMNTARGEQTSLRDFFYAIKHDPDKIIIICAVEWCFSIPWQLVIVYSEYAAKVLALEPGMAMMLEAIILVILFTVNIIASILLSQCYYLYIDRPELNAREIMLMSLNVMNRHKLQYFNLELSMIGLVLLMVITLGIGAFWIMPYIYTIYVNYYEDLKGEFDGYNLKT